MLNKIRLYALLAIMTSLNQLSECSVTVTIEGKLKLPQQETQINSTQITLNDAEFSTYSKSDGSFTFYNIPEGIYVLDIHSSSYYFSQIKIQVSSDDTIKCIEYLYPGSTKQAIPHPLELEAHGAYNYFEPRKGFGLLNLLKNPMVLMMIASFGFMYMMPKMMEGLDDEQKEQMQRQMEMQSDPSKMFNQLWGELSGNSDENKVTSTRRAKRD